MFFFNNKSLKIFFLASIFLYSCIAYIPVYTMYAHQAQQENHKEQENLGWSPWSSPVLVDINGFKPAKPEVFQVCTMYAHQDHQAQEKKHKKQDNLGWSLWSSPLLVDINDFQSIKATGSIKPTQEQQDQYQDQEKQEDLVLIKSPELKPIINRPVLSKNDIIDLVHTAYQRVDQNLTQLKKLNQRAKKISVSPLQLVFSFLSEDDQVKSPLGVIKSSLKLYQEEILYFHGDQETIFYADQLPLIVTKAQKAVEESSVGIENFEKILLETECTKVQENVQKSAKKNTQEIIHEQEVVNNNFYLDSLEEIKQIKINLNSYSHKLQSLCALWNIHLSFYSPELHGELNKSDMSQQLCDTLEKKREIIVESIENIEKGMQGAFDAALYQDILDTQVIIIELVNSVDQQLKLFLPVLKQRFVSYCEECALQDKNIIPEIHAEISDEDILDVLVLIKNHCKFKKVQKKYNLILEDAYFIKNNLSYYSIRHTNLDAIIKLFVSFKECLIEFEEENPFWDSSNDISDFCNTKIDTYKKRLYKLNKKFQEEKELILAHKKSCKYTLSSCVSCDLYAGILEDIMKKIKALHGSSQDFSKAIITHDEDIIAGVENIHTLNNKLNKDLNELKSKLYMIYADIKNDDIKNNKKLTKHMCNYCSENQETGFRCGRCQEVFYCNKECQVMDWKNHKLVCQKKTIGE